MTKKTKTLQEYHSILEMEEDLEGLEWSINHSFEDDTPLYYQRLADYYFLQNNFMLAAHNYSKCLLSNDCFDEGEYSGYGNK